MHDCILAPPIRLTPQFSARYRFVASYLMMDMAHISGLVAAQVQNDPFEVCDVVCTTT